MPSINSVWQAALSSALCALLRRALATSASLLLLSLTPVLHVMAEDSRRAFSPGSLAAFARDCPGGSSESNYWDWESAMFNEALAHRLQLDVGALPKRDSQHTAPRDHEHNETEIEYQLVNSKGTDGDESISHAPAPNVSTPAVLKLPWARPAFCAGRSAALPTRPKVATCIHVEHSEMTRHKACTVEEEIDQFEDEVVRKALSANRILAYRLQGESQRKIVKIIVDGES